jgi:glycosyltransferase involved in cell wall biosynthesis
MKILLSNFRYFVSGGSESYLFAIQEMLREKGHEVFPFSVRSSRNAPNAYEDWFLSPIGDDASAYFSEYRKTAKTLLKVISRQVYSPEGFLKARRFAKFCKPDLVYSIQFLNKMSPAVLDGFKSAGLPVVQRISDFGMLCPQGHFFDGKRACTLCINGNYMHAVTKRCIMDSRAAGMIKGGALTLQRLLRCRQRVDAYIFPSRFTMTKFAEAGFPEHKLHFVPTPIDAGAIRPAFASSGNFLYFGRLVPEKGVHLLLEAYRKLPAEKPKLVVIGAQATTPYAKALMDEYTEAEFMDFLPKQELAAHIRSAFCVIVPSVWYDNLPNVLLEAYAYGKPVIAPAHGSFLELVADGRTGIRFKAGDPHDLRDKLEWAMQHPSQMAEMGRTARLLAETEYSPALHYQRISAIFGTVLHGGNG